MKPPKAVVGERPTVEEQVLSELGTTHVCGVVGSVCCEPVGTEYGSGCWRWLVAVPER